MTSAEWIANAKAVPIEDEIKLRGIKLRGNGSERVGPCPICGGHDRFAVNLVKQIWNCRGCGRGGDIIALVRHLDGCDFNTAVETLSHESRPCSESRAPCKPNTPSDYQAEQHRKAARLWSRRQPIAGTIAERYLRKARGITCPLPATLGYLPAWRDHHPALISAFGLAEEIEPGVLAAPTNAASVHLTLLRPDGTGKADVAKAKFVIGSPAGMPIVLAPMADAMGLAVTEGVEDALSVHQVTGLGAWAAGSAPFLLGLVAAIKVARPEALTIFVDGDRAGRINANKLRAGLVTGNAHFPISMAELAR